METLSQKREILGAILKFQKDLIVWKQITEEKMSPYEKKFQKDLIVWKQHCNVSDVAPKIGFRRT